MVKKEQYIGIKTKDLKTLKVISDSGDILTLKVKAYDQNSDLKKGDTLKVTVETVEKQNNFLPMLHGKATDKLATMAGVAIKENNFSNTGMVERFGVKLTLNDFNSFVKTIGISAHKLLSAAIIEFTSINHTGNHNRHLRNLRVNIPLKEYALSCGYDVIEHNTSIEETKRVENTLKEARRKIKRDIKLLISSSLSWEENIKGKKGDFHISNILGSGGIRKGFINLEFTLSMAEYLIILPLSQYPVALFAVDERNPNAYNIGLKMSNHFNLDNNHIMGTSQCLKVKTLLENINLPKIETIRAKRRSWEDRIKEPFENSLDVLTKCGVIENWKYCHSKEIDMTDEEATNWSSYEKWEKTLIHFTLKNSKNHKLRLELKPKKSN